MNNVPQMISTKDLSYISDMFEWIITSAKKVNHFSNEVQDTEIKEILTEVVNMHAQHCQQLVTILEQGGNE